jgi:2-dehydro-3-deoxyphosphogluconate aldolase / (4S)-4-hydroxy-2-oxoglutarate aldolase
MSHSGADPLAAAALRLRRSPIADLIRTERIVAVLRRVEPQERLLTFVGELLADGVRVFEITFDGLGAADDVRAVRALLATDGQATDGRPRAIVGAGTVLTSRALRDAHDAGAAFAVSPTFDAAVVRDAVALGLPVVPGAYTPTEIRGAWLAGATFIKLFPASSLGPSHVRELHGPFPDIECIATGGVDATNARAFLDAGCVAIGIGGALTRASREDRRTLLAAARGTS